MDYLEPLVVKFAPNFAPVASDALYDLNEIRRSWELLDWDIVQLHPSAIIPFLLALNWSNPLAAGSVKRSVLEEIEARIRELNLSNASERKGLTYWTELYELALFIRSSHDFNQRAQSL